MPEPKWIQRAVVLALHSEQLAEHGGSDGIRDEDLLDSALAKPRNLLAYTEPDLFDLAASYAFGLARNHPFLDGNKRTALAVSLTFLYLHGWEIEAPKESLYTTFLALADGSLSEGDLGGWLRQFSIRIPAK
jgi:death-on-curing protein